MTRLMMFFMACMLDTAVMAESVYAVSGADLYGKHCSNCHGIDGKGGIGLPLNSPKLSKLFSDKYIKNTIKYGRFGRIMPSFSGKLDDKRINLIVEHLRSWQPDPTRRITYGIQDINGDYNKGEAIYKKECQRCHGDKLQGEFQGIESAGSKPSKLDKNKVATPALSNIGFLKSASDEFLLATIYHGREDSSMPSYGDKGYTKEQLKDLVFYLRKRGTILAPQWEVSQKVVQEPIYILYESPYDYKRTKENIYQTIKAMNFRAYKPRLLEMDLGNNSKDIDPNKQVYRFCNFQMLDQFLKIEPRLGVFLPCNITVIKTKDNRVLVSAPNLKRVLPMFNNSLLNEKIQGIDDILLDLIEEALL